MLSSLLFVIACYNNQAPDIKPVALTELQKCSVIYVKDRGPVYVERDDIINVRWEADSLMSAIINIKDGTQLLSDEMGQDIIQRIDDCQRPILLDQKNTEFCATYYNDQPEQTEVMLIPPIDFSSLCETKILVLRPKE